MLSAIHEQTAVTGLVAIAVHGAHPARRSVAQSRARRDLDPLPDGLQDRFGSGLGIIAGWLAALLGLTFYIRRRIGPRLWRRAHKATVLVYALGVAHTLGAGTDASSPWLFSPVVASIPVIAGLFVARVVARHPQGTRERTVGGRPARGPRPASRPPTSRFRRGTGAAMQSRSRQSHERRRHPDRRRRPRLPARH